MSLQRKKWLTIFHSFFPAMLQKDVGALPYYLSSVSGWECSLAFFGGEEVSAQTVDADFQQKVALVPLGPVRGRLLNAFRLITFFMARSRQFDVVNFYHDSVKNMAYALVYKLFNPGGVVYFKLDMSHLELRALEADRHKPLSALARRVKGLLSKIAVTLYTVETTSCYQALMDDSYFTGRLQYLPNGFAGPEDADIDEIVASKENIILTVGNLGAYAKYSELLIDAVTLLDREMVEGWKVYLVGPLVNADFYEAGYREDDSFQRYVEAAVTRNPHLKDTFVFTGNIEDKCQLFDIYRKAKIFCLTSRYESFGFVLLEAMYFGDHVISSDFPASRDITGNGTIGSLFPVGDAQRLAELVAKAIKGDTDPGQSGRTAHEFVRKNFNWSAIAGELDRLLTPLMPQNPARPQP